ncbi:MAG: sensor histidine kinase [Ignavibacteriaceae bacterium]
MIRLVPEWARHYEEFWSAIKKRNIWFIKLRYYAVIALLIFIILSEYILDFSLTYFQLYALLIIGGIIIIYNIIFHLIKDRIKEIPGKFNVLHFSLLQILFDLLTLAVIVYLTGGSVSPLYYLFIFHMIIGSLILPGKVVYTLAFIIIISFFSLSLLELNGIIPHQYLSGYTGHALYNNVKYILISNFIFSFVILASVYFANGIARQLYKLEQDLVESFDKLRQAEIEKQKYIMAVVHEIKSPLTVVITYLDIILSKMLGPLPKEIEDRIDRSIVRVREAVTLINNVLRISKLRLLNEIVFEEYEIGEIIERVVSARKSNLESKRIDLVITDNRLTKNILKGDKFLMEMVLSNLLSNAIKYTSHDGNIRIVISEIQAMLEVRISDDGIGIPHNDLVKMFGDFFRASNAKKDGFEGTGLGLSIVKQVIEKHRGEIKIDSPSDISKEGRPGTIAIISLPIVVMEEPATKKNHD